MEIPKINDYSLPANSRDMLNLLFEENGDLRISRPQNRFMMNWER